MQTSVAVPSWRFEVNPSWQARGCVLLPLCLLLCGATILGAQDPAVQLYEGLHVATVQLVAEPSVRVEDYQPLVAQKAGANYSTADVNRTVAALQATGKFSKIDTQVEPGTDGLRVTFLLEPVYYVGMIYFPGATKAFSYPRLLETVNYPKRDPYQADRVTQGKTLLARFLTEHGYFAAQVVAETAFDEVHKLANITYRVQLNRRAKFGDIQITGPDAREIARLQSALHSWRAWIHGATVKKGKRFSSSHLEAATRLLQNYLGKEHHFANTVELEPPTYDPETNQAALHWKVKLGPVVLVRVTGAKLSRRSLHSLVPVYEENAFDQDLVEEGERNLVSYFQNKGYQDAAVKPQTQTEPAQITLTYHVDLGTRRRVTEVKITGNRHFDEDELASQVTVQKAEFFSHGKYSNDLVGQSVKNLTAFYRAAGYSEVQVQPSVAEQEREVSVSFRIREGELTRVAALHVEGNTTQPIDKLAPSGLNLKEGQPYSQPRLDKDRGQILASYINMGYPNATLRWKVQPAGSHRVNVTYLINEGPQVHISDVAIVGAVHTHTSFLRHNTSVKAGDPLSESRVLQSEDSLYNLAIFDSASVDPRTPITDQTSEEVLVRVHEAKRNSLTYGLGVLYTPVEGSLSSGIVALPGLPTLGIPKSFKVIEKTVFSPLGSLEFSRLNLTGRADTASVSTFLSALDQRGAFTYTYPQFRGLTWSTLLNVSAERSSQNPLFTARLGTGSFQFERTLDPAKTQRVQIRYQFQRTTLTNLLILNFIPPEDQNVRSSLISASYIRDTRDKPLDAHRGFFQTLDLGVSPHAIGSTDNFVRFFGQNAYYRQVKPWMVWANDVRLGLVGAFSNSHVPISEKFFSGGADSLRGFPLNGAGPQVQATLCRAANDLASCTAHIAAPEGGRQLFIVNSEGRFPIPVTFPSPINRNLGAAVFYDGGNVYNAISFKGFLSDFTNTIGIGLRYQTPIGPVRIDLGHNLNPVPGIKSTNLFVTLGQSF